MTSSHWQQLLARAAAPALALALVAAAPVAGAAVTGTMVDAQTQQPIALPNYPNVILYQCLRAGDTFCTGFVGFAEAGADGRYTIPTGDVPAGRYQLLAGASDYSYTYSPTFELATGGALQKDLTLSTLPLAFGDVLPCTAVDAGGWCRFEYTLSNRSATSQAVQVWAHAFGHTNMPAPDAGYSSGDGSFDPMQVTLAAGEARRIVQAIYLGVRDAGSTSSISFYASPVGQANSSLGYFDAGVLADHGGQVGLLRRSARIEQARAGTQARRLTARTAAPAALSTQAAADAAAATAATAIGPFFFGIVTAADTGAPVDLSLSPRMRLVTCALPTDEFCAQSSGEFVYLDESGRFRLNTSAVVPARYQIEAQARSGYGLARSPAFDAPAASGGLLNLVLPKPILALANVSGCEAVDPADGGCTIAYDVTNTTPRPQSLSVWLQVNAYLSGSDVGFSTFVAGDPAKMAPTAVRLKAGQTLRLQQRVSLSQALKAGAEGELRVYVGAPRDPSHADAFTSLGYYTVTASGSVLRRTGGER